ncbi:MAG: DJ-1/PfpI family protein [Gammaproteobacteria bacterium]|nr:DJ-1/PfpI family protein [Gammaproteobacteria bacterium]
MTQVLVPLAQGCEELEAVTIIDLLRRAGMTVVSAGLDQHPVKASRGTVFLPDTTLEEALNYDYDMIVLPGGMPGANHLRDDARVQDLLKKMARQGKYTAAICAAPKALARAGLLTGKRVTSFPGSLDEVLDSVQYLEQAVVIDGKVITSRGPGTAMEFALVLIEQVLGRQKRMEVEAPLQRM